MRLIYLLLFIAPQVLLYLYLRDRLPDPARPRRARLVRAGLAAVFTVLNFPWIFVAGRVLFGNLWGTGEIPYLGPWIAWQIIGWGLFGAVALYVVGWVIWSAVKRVRGAWYVVRHGADRDVGNHREQQRTTHHAPISRRSFLARATYAYAGVGAALSGYGIWSAGQLPEITRSTLWFDDLPAGLDGLRILHVSDVHAGIHMQRDKMTEVVARANALRPDLVIQTGDMIDIDPEYIADYVAAFRDLHAPLGVVTCLGNHDHYTGAAAVSRGVRDAGQTLVKSSVQVVERGDAALALLGIDDPAGWEFDDPQQHDIDAVLRRAPSPLAAFRILLAHRPGAFDGAAPRGIPLTLSGHIHGGQIYLPVLGWSAGRLITKYVQGHFVNGNSQLYVSRGIGVVGVPIRIFVPPEMALLELRRRGRTA
jgi:uncharacterized protein